VDGLSNTLAFGEYLGGFHNNGKRDYELAWMGAGWQPTKYGLAPIYGSSWATRGNDYTNNQFQSAHTGRIVNFAFADGHVAGIGITADFNAYIYASGMHDGEAYDPSGLE
jgi:prepilin-type processing-associated H-X9-DG protein